MNYYLNEYMFKLHTNKFIYSKEISINTDLARTSELRLLGSFATCGASNNSFAVVLCLYSALRASLLENIHLNHGYCLKNEFEQCEN